MGFTTTGSTLELSGNPSIAELFGWNTEVDTFTFFGINVDDVGQA